MITQLQLQVTGDEQIHCAGCETRIGFALRRLPGVHEVRASAQTQQVCVSFDLAQVTPEQLRARLQQLGYEAA